MKISCLRTSGLSTIELVDILDEFRDYLDVIKCFISFFRMGVIKNLKFAKKAQKDFVRKYFEKWV